jgi:ribonuclease HIII
MAAKSITVARTAAATIDALAAAARERMLPIERRQLQNGERIIIGDWARLNVYPSKDGGCKIVFDRPDAPAADAIASLLDATPSVVKPAKASAGTLEALGVRDSKSLSDAAAGSLAGQVRDAYPVEVVTIGPKRYNEMWAKMGSVNRVLAWAHARAIENVLERAPEATAAVADQFGDESLIRDALFKRGKAVQLLQMPRAERDPAVAAASIVARAEFLRRLRQLGEQAGLLLPKGASDGVEGVARALIAKLGRDALPEYAKIHFRTTRRVLS